MLSWAAVAKTSILVARFVVAVKQRSGAGLRNEHRSSAQEVHDRRHVKNVLVIARKEEDAVRTDRSSNRAAKLMLPAVGLEIEEGRLRSEQNCRA